MLTQIDGLTVFHLQVFFGVNKFNVSAFTNALKGKANDPREQGVGLFYFSRPKLFLIILLHFIYISNMKIFERPFQNYIYYIILNKKTQQKSTKTSPTEKRATT